VRHKLVAHREFVDYAKQSELLEKCAWPELERIVNFADNLYHAVYAAFENCHSIEMRSSYTLQELFEKDMPTHINLWQMANAFNAARDYLDSVAGLRMRDRPGPI
jgi:hypothetical protein